MGVAVLDAGVVIAGLDAEDRHHEAAGRALRLAGERGDSFVLPASAFAEVLVRPAARGDATLTRVEAAIDALGVDVAPATRTIAHRAAVLRARHQGLRLPDALVIATALELDTEHLVTTDRHWRSLRLAGLRDRLIVVGAS